MFVSFISNMCKYMPCRFACFYLFVQVCMGACACILSSAFIVNQVAILEVAEQRFTPQVLSNDYFTEVGDAWLQALR